MTYATDSNSIPQKSFSLRGLVNMFAQRRRYTSTLRELGALSDRELKDIGLNRGMLPTVAREAMHVAR